MGFLSVDFKQNCVNRSNLRLQVKLCAFFLRTYGKYMISYTSTQSKMTPIWKHDSCSPRGDNSYLLFIVTDGCITRGI